MEECFMGKKQVKTNAMRILDRAAIDYEVQTYEVDENDVSGEHVAKQLKQDPSQVFKTLVLCGERIGYLVCCIPVNQELDLKKVAHAANEKRVEMLALKEVLPVTGYIRGGCSPIGMKKQFLTIVDETAILFDKIILSGGLRGVQIKISAKQLEEVIPLTFANLVKESQ